MEEEVPSGSDNIVAEFASYEEFLDSHIKPIDLFYLEVNCCVNFLLVLFTHVFKCGQKVSAREEILVKVNLTSRVLLCYFKFISLNFIKNKIRQ